MTQGSHHRFAFALTAGLSLAVFSARAGEIKQVDVSTGATGTRAEIQLAGSGGFKTLSLANPNRLVVDFPASSAKSGLKLPAAAGLVTSVRTGQPVPGTFRVVFELATPVTALKPQMQTLGSASTLVIEWPGDFAPAKPVASTSSAVPAATTPPAAVPATRPLDAQAEAARATAALAASAQRASALPPPTPAPAPTPVPVPASAMPTVTPAPVPTTIATGVPTPRPGTVAAPGAPATTGGTRTTIATGTPSPAAILNGGNVAQVAPQGAAVTSAGVAAADAQNDDVPPRPLLPSEASRVKMAPGMRPLVVAIDPGHGGQDPGAMGPTGKREKDVTLAIGRELARQINATQGMKAYMTRDTDVFIPLLMRAQKARSAKADIFISIHADAA